MPPPEAVWGAAAHKKVKIITEFAELPKSVSHIQIPAGVEEAELGQYLQFPETLEAYVMEGYLEAGSSDNKKATDSNAQTGKDAETATPSDARYTVSIPESVYGKATASNAHKPERASSSNIEESSAAEPESDEDDEYFEDEELFADIPVLTDIEVTWEQDEGREPEAGSMYYLPVLPTGYVLADGVELPEIQVSLESGIALFAAEDVIDIADVETNANGQIIINAENLQEWDGKILTGSVTSTGLYDPAKGIVIQGGQSDSDWITVNLTIRDLTIDRKEYMRNGFSAISVEDCATLNLTVEGDNELYGAYGGAGIGVVGHGTGLCITGNSTGSLYAKGGNGYGGAAGIGSISPGWDLNSSSSEPKTQDCGVITIAGGNITAEGGTYSFRGSKISGGAGIGATYGMSAGHITISGGTVHAIGGCGGAGIGGGTNGSVDTITINGGTVIAEGTGSGSKQPAAIGLGVDTNTDESKVTSCGMIDIAHANVIAKGNIGYGYVLCGNYPWADVSIQSDVYLTIDGVVNAGGMSVKQYELNFSVFDTSFKEGPEIEIQSVELDGNKIQENIIAEVKTPGRADFTVSFAHTTFSEEREFYITVEGKEYPYDATINFVEDETKYHGIAGIELYPVDLEFYDSAITGDIVPEEVTIKQDNTPLSADDDYVSSNTIEMVDDGVGRMRVFLPANEGTTEITVKAAGINGSNEMTRSGLTVSKDGITSVVMCSGIVTLSAEVTKLDSDNATVTVKSNAMTWELYALRSNDTEITVPETIVSEKDIYQNMKNTQACEVAIDRLEAGKTYRYYMVAKQDESYSPIICVEFSTPYGARVLGENGSEVKTYPSFLDAIANANNITQDNFTIQAQGISEQRIGAYYLLRKSCTLDLNGKKITNSYSSSTLAIDENISAKLVDSVGTAEYHNEYGNRCSLLEMKDGSSLTIQGGNYYDYKDLLQDGDPSGRTLTIEGGSFHGNNYINIGGNGTLILSGGTFYGGLNVGGGGNEMGAYLKPGYCFHYLSGVKVGTYTTTLLLGTSDDIEIVPYPALEGELTLTIGNGIYSQAVPGTTLTASFAQKGTVTGTETYTYTWYRPDGTTEIQIKQISATTATTDTYTLTDDDIGSQIYCVVTEKQSSGSIESEKTYQVIGYSIEGAVVTLTDGTWEYDGAEKKPQVESVMLGESVRLVEGTHYTVSYENNINAGNEAKVIITGTGIYEGTATTTFEIKKKWVNDLTFEGMQEEYEYTGEEIRPQFTLKDGDVTIPDSEYTVEYFHNIKPTTTGYITAVRVTPKLAGNYSFISYTTGEKQFKIVHTHDWECSVGGWVINLECKKNVCPFQNKRATIMLAVDDAENLAYNGKTQNVAKVWQAPSDAYTGDLKVEYAGDGLENGLPKNAGKYTASLTITENGVSYTAKNNFEIKKVTPDIGTVTAGELTDTVDVNQVQLSRANTTVPGTLKLKEGTELQWGTHEYEWVFEPDDSTNYNSVEDTVSITVKDTIPPTAEWKIGTSAWKEFVNTITLGHLCKNPETMEIRFSDELSGIAKQQYYIADQRMTDFSGVTWTDYSSPINLPLGREKIVYVRVEDRDNNVVILNSDKFAVYQESSLKYNEIPYKYKEGQPKEIRLEENGNTFANVVNESGKNLENSSYDYWDGRLTMNPAYLNSLSVGTHSYKILMYPQGNREYSTIAYDFQIKVEKPKLYVAAVRASDKKYDGNNFADITEVVLACDDVPSIENVSVDMTGLQGTLESADAGTYKEITLPELTLTGTEAGNYELIQPMAPVEIWQGGVTIMKAHAPAITWPIAKTIESGQELQASKLTGGSTEYGTFAWKNPSQKAEEGTYTYDVIFTPNAQTEKNYEITELTEQVSLLAVSPASVKHEGEVVAAEPKVAPVDADAPQEEKDIANVLQNTPPAITGLEHSAKDLLQTGENGELQVKTGENQTITGTRAKEMLQNEGINTAGKTVKLVVEPYMEVAVNGVTEENGKRIISLEISARYNVKATTAGTGESMEESGTGRNTIVIGTGIQYQVDTPVTITIPLPADYPVENLFIRHILHSGKNVYYPATVTAKNGVNLAKFVNKDGFSTFELLYDGRNGSIVYDQEIGTRSYTLEQVGDDLPAVDRSGYRFLGWKINGTIYTDFTLELLNLIDAAEGKSVAAEAVLEKISSDSENGGSGNGNNGNGSSSSGSGSSGGRSGGSGSVSASVSQGSWSAVMAAGITKWRFADLSGAYAANTWKQISWNGIVSWYHFDAEGYMDVGWLADTDGHWYYSNPVSDGTQGAMITGWRKIDGIWYFFNPVSDGTKGAMYHGRKTLDGYYVDENGAWDGKER